MGAQEYNRAAWPLLVRTARAGKTVTYQDVANAVNRVCHSRLTPYTTGPHALDRIERWCLLHGIPDLTAVVVSQEFGIPGHDFFQQNGLDPEASQGKQHYQWSLIRNLVWEHAYDGEPPSDL